MSEQNANTGGCPSATVEEQGCGGSCGESSACQGCAAFQQAELPHNIKNVIAIASGKGGVGKSSTTAMLAAALRRKGLKVGIMDADITGPSIPRMVGLHQNVVGDGEFILPAETDEGIKVMSINLMLEDENAPVIWRGPVISNLLRQFWNQVRWGDLDVLLIDMPPGTGDVPITIFQSIPVDGIIMVTMPQQLVGMIVNKAIGMAGLVDVPIIGVIENMSYFVCPDCGGKMDVFGESGLDSFAKNNGLEVLARMPIIPDVARLSDEGKSLGIENEEVKGIAEVLIDKKLNL